MDDTDKVLMRVRNVFLEKGSAILKGADRAVLEDEIESKPLREALTYHVGRWRDLTRPALMALACEAVGGKGEDVTAAAEALILLSGAIDIHDDIIDSSTMRKSKPTLLGEFGRDITLLASDILILKGFARIYGMIEQSIPYETVVKIVKILKELLLDLADAEALELDFRGRWDVAPAEYLRVIRKKAADVEAYMRIGATIGGGSEEEINILGEYGRILGVMAILRDDLEDMLDFEIEMINRIKKEGLPLPLLYALKNPDAHDQIVEIIKKVEIDAEDAEAIFDLVEESGGLTLLSQTFRDLKNRGTDLLRNIRRSRGILAEILEATVPPI